MADSFLGVDLGGTNVVAALMTSEGQVLARETAPTEVQRGPEALVQRLGASLGRLVEQAGVPRATVRALGIGSPGPLSVAAGKIIRSCNLPGFDDFPLRAACSRALGVPAVIDNDAKAACWGEYWLGAGRGVRHMVMFTLGTGIGGGIVIDGRLVHGSEDNAAELGHMIIVPEGRRCNCGQRGCLEAYASATHTAGRAREAAAAGRASSLAEVLERVGEISCRDVFEQARAGDALAVEVVEGTARALAQACVNMRHITEPEKVVLGGGMTQAGDFLLERVRRHYESLLWTNKKEDMVICLAERGADAGVIGAAGLALEAWRGGALPAAGT